MGVFASENIIQVVIYDKKELAIVVEAIGGLIETEELVSFLFSYDCGISEVDSDSPFGKLDKVFDLIYEYIPQAKDDDEVESRIYDILYRCDSSVEEQFKAIEELRAEGKAKKA